MFICQINGNINGSRLLAWRSEEYIDDLLTFTVIGNMLLMMTIEDPVHNGTEAIYNATGTSLLVLKPRADAPNATILRASMKILLAVIAHLFAFWVCIRILHC